MREVGYSLRAYLTHRLTLCSIAPLNERRISGSAERPNWNPMSGMGLSLPSHSAPGPANVRSCPKADKLLQCRECPLCADFVVKVPTRGVTISPPEDETSRDRRLNSLRLVTEVAREFITMR